MTKTNAFQNGTADSSGVISRNTGEAYSIELWTVSSDGVPSSSKRTYSKSEGFYQISEQTDESLVDELEDVVDALFAKYGAVDESPLNRLRGESFEVVVETVPESTLSPYDDTYSGNHVDVTALPNRDESLVGRIDSVLAEL